MSARRSALLLVVTLFCLDAHAWWNDAWKYRKRIEFDPAVLATLDGEARDVAVLLRLHPGNFDFFLDVRDDGGDLRFIADDEITPYPYHIESFDPAVGVALVWVNVPRVGVQAPGFWMYYGNPAAPPGADSSATYPKHQALVLHFDEAAGPPQDASSYGHSAVRASLTRTPSGLIGAGGVFGPGDTVVLPASPALELGADSGVSVSAWLKFSAPDDPDDTAVIVSQGDQGNSLQLALTNGHLRLLTGDPAGERAAEIAAALAFDRWYHVALVIGDQARLYLDGVESAALPAPAAPFGGPVRIGAIPGGIKGFSGTIDELQIANTALAPVTLILAASTQVPEANPFTLGEDESYSADEAVGEYLGLMASMFATVRPEGWLILGLLGLMGLLTIDVIVSKSLALSRTETADRRFLALYGEPRPRTRSGLPDLDDIDDEHFRDSTIAPLFRIGADSLAEADRTSDGIVRAAAIEVARAEIDARLVQLNEVLNRRMVVLTMAVSGAPFLGLLGTVLGVMITFATIAATGDVNVNTIAPGVAAALTTTVAGLIVAIPALFGYNYLAGRITRRLSAMETFADQILSRAAHALANPARAEERANEAA